MRKFFIFALSLICCASWVAAEAKPTASLRNDKVAVAVDKDGNLTQLTNLSTGHNYASGGYLWRMFYDSHDEREIQIMPEQQKAHVECDGSSIVISYPKLTDIDGKVLKISLRPTITIEGDEVHFASSVTNNVEHTVIRELDYPLVHNAQLPKDHALIMSHSGGRSVSTTWRYCSSRRSKRPQHNRNNHRVCPIFWAHSIFVYFWSRIVSISHLFFILLQFGIESTIISEKLNEQNIQNYGNSRQVFTTGD